MTEVNTNIDDGTEIRQSSVRVRVGGIKEMLVAISKIGFCSIGTGRLAKLDGELVFDFCFNAGTTDTKVKALPVTFSIPLTETEQKFVAKASTLDENEIEDEKFDAVIDSADSVD